ncbi:MAG: hypothetical protein AB7V26_03450 [Lysobacterales bacterium]
MATSAVQSLKLSIVGALGLSKDALHIHVGLLAFIFAALVFRKPFHSFAPWLSAASAAVIIEAMDAYDDLRSFGLWRWEASLHDIANTLLWPTLLALLFRARALRQRVCQTAQDTHFSGTE